MTNLSNNSRTRKHDFLAQKKKVFQSLFQRPQTMLMVSREVCVMRENICRYIRDFKKSNTVCAVKEDVDPITGFKATFWSTDPRVCRECEGGKQLTIFHQ